MPHILIVSAPFYKEISDQLVAGAAAHLQAQDATFEMVEVPGALEVPAAIRFASNTNLYDGFVALGCVIRGETTHYDYVCSESAHGLQHLAVEHQLAIGNGILTVENKSQAMERAHMEKKNKGGDAAHACLQMVALKHKWLDNA